MSEKCVELTGRFCPYPVVEVIREVDEMTAGQEKVFYVDDPLAVKSIPEELEEYDDITIVVEKQGNKWMIKVEKA